MSQGTERRSRMPESLQSLYAPVRVELGRVHVMLQEELDSQFPFVAQLTQHGLQLGGKRLRPALLLLSGKTCGPLAPEHNVLGVAVEMIHMATLVHDDVLDDATLRRHRETINTLWDNEASVMLGDYMLALAISMVGSLDSGFACRAIGEAARIMCEGELRQIASRGNYELGEEDYLQIIAGKTAALYACACRLGAHYSGADVSTREALARFGENLGVAFQIVDDVLDVLGDEATTGKSLGTDLVKQKPTLPLISLLERSDGPERSRIVDLLSRNGTAQRETLRPRMEETGAIDYARRRAVWFIRRAVEELAVVPPSEARDALEQIAQFVLDRQQ